MALIFDKAVPEGVVAAAQETLERLALVGNARGGASLLPERFVSRQPLAVYTLGLSGLVRGGGLDQAAAVAWRVFVVDDCDEPVGSAEVASAAGADPPAFLGYTRGPQVVASGRALADAEAAQGRYEPRFLEIPGISASALWLKNLSGGDDRIIPVDPVPRFLRDQAAYVPAEFLERVRPRARERLDHDDVPSRDHR